MANATSDLTLQDHSIILDLDIALKAAPLYSCILSGLLSEWVH